MGHTVPFGIISLALMHIEPLGRVGKTSFWKYNFFRKRLFAIEVWFWCSCVLQQLPFAKIRNVVEELFLQGGTVVCSFRAVPLSSSSPWRQMTGNTLQWSFGVTMFWYTERGTPSWGRRTLILDGPLTFRLMILWSNRLEYSPAWYCRWNAGISTPVGWPCCVKCVSFNRETGLESVQ